MSSEDIKCGEISSQLLLAVNEVLAGRRYAPAEATGPNKKDVAD